MHHNTTRKTIHDHCSVHLLIEYVPNVVVDSEELLQSIAQDGDAGFVAWQTAQIMRSVQTGGQMVKTVEKARA